MTNQEVFSLMHRAKVYIDFGNHPGKDRIPREAAISGCCVLTNRNGSAAFYDDVPIPDSYKFGEDASIPSIIRKIRECLDDYEEEEKNFDSYREYIRNEKKKFLDDVKSIFCI